MQTKRILTLAAFTIVMCSGSAAYADPREFYLLNQPVEKRVHPDFKTDGAEFRGFIFRPELTAGLQYNDNVFASEDDEESDFTAIAIPSLRITKQSGSHDFSLEAEARQQKYFSNSDEDRLGYKVGTKGTFHLGSQLSMLYGLDTGRTFISREGQDENRLTREPIDVQTSRAELGFAKRFNRIKLDLMNSVTRKTYDNGVSQESGQQEIFEDNDRNIYLSSLTVGYDILGVSGRTPEHTLFGQISAQRTRFDDKSAATGLSADNDQLGLLAGFLTSYKGLAFGRIGVGYFMQDFEDSEDVSRLDIEADLSFNISPKTTLRLGAGRDVKQDNGFTAGFVDTDIRLGMDYEFLHDTYIGALQTYKNRDFLGELDGREEDIYSSSIFLRHNHNRYLETNLQFEHRFQESNQPGGDYDQNIVMFYITGKL